LTGPGDTLTAQKLGSYKGLLDRIRRNCLGVPGHWEKVNIYASVDAFYSRVEFAVDARHHKIWYHVSTGARIDQSPRQM